MDVCYGCLYDFSRAPAEAAELANLAAGVVVGKMGTVPVHFEELEAVLPE